MKGIFLAASAIFKFEERGIISLQTHNAVTQSHSTRRVIVVGGTGVIGSPLVQALVRSGFKSLVLSRTADGISSGGFDMRLHDIRVAVPDLNCSDTVILLAAYSDQSWINEHPAEARQLNVDASQRLANLVIGSGARFVCLSSEAVFGDALSGRSGWTEQSPVSPRTEYGRQKAELEQSLIGRQGCAIIRTGWNVGWNAESRCVVRKTYESLLTADCKINSISVLTLTDVRDTCAGIVCVVRDNLQGVFHFASSPANRSEMADLIVATSRLGHKMKYEVVPAPLLIPSMTHSPDSWLSSGASLERIGLTFRPWRDVVREKVTLLESGRTS